MRFYYPINHLQETRKKVINIIPSIETARNISLVIMLLRYINKKLFNISPHILVYEYISHVTFS